tara:strand:+ start:220 stop:1140 length:921 start_codon:yes stop_codon:yes gene_type:complete
MRWRTWGDPLHEPVHTIPWNKGTRGICSVKGCNNLHNSKGFCAKHYSRWKRNGDPLSLKGRTPNEETRKKISKSNSGKKRTKAQRKAQSERLKGVIPWNKGLTKETHPSVKSTSENLKGNKIRKGYKTPAKTKKKIAKTLKEKWKHEEHYMKGWNPTEEMRRKIGLKHKGKTVSEDARVKIRKARLKQVFPVEDTKLEKELQKMLRKNKIKFKTHMSIVGQPDIFIKPNLCIFADGDYWHGWFYLKGKDYSTQKSINNAYFEKKIRDDKRITSDLRKLGYKVLRFWEHEIYNNPEKCMKEIFKIIN